MTEEEARRWPDLIRIVETKVKPKGRLAENREIRARKEVVLWGDTTPALFEAIRGLDRVLVHVSDRTAWLHSPSYRRECVFHTNQLFRYVNL